MKVGILKNLRKKFGEIIKIVFGRNSATRRIIAVDKNVLIRSTKISDPSTGVSKLPRLLEKTKPYITREKLLPISIVAISVSYTHLRAHETDSYIVCRLL